MGRIVVVFDLAAAPRVFFFFATLAAFGTEADDEDDNDDDGRGGGLSCVRIKVRGAPSDKEAMTLLDQPRAER